MTMSNTDYEVIATLPLCTPTFSEKSTSNSFNAISKQEYGNLGV